MFDSFKKEYYGIDSPVGGTQVNFTAFKTLFPILVFDVRKQNEKLKSWRDRHTSQIILQCQRSRKHECIWMYNFR